MFIEGNELWVELLHINDTYIINLNCRWVCYSLLLTLVQVVWLLQRTKYVLHAGHVSDSWQEIGKPLCNLLIYVVR